MKGIYKLKKQKKDKRDYKLSDLIYAKAASIPASIDIRKAMPAVFDQGQLGSCSANSNTAALMFAMYGANKISYTLLSRLFEYYNSRAKEGTTGEDDGATNRDAAMVTVKLGICEESFNPYDINNFTVKPTADAYKDGLKHKALSCHAVKNLAGIKQSLVFGLPVVIGMEVFDSFEGTDIEKTGKMPMPKKGEKNLGGHSVLVCGYQDLKPIGLLANIKHTLLGASTGYLIVRNSWGDSWGDKGYFYMPYEYISKNTFDYWTINA